MIIYHKEFKELNWRPNKTVLNTQINPEVDFFTIDTDDYISFEPIVDKPKHGKLSFGYITIHWLYTIENKNGKELFFYDAEDTYTADTSKLSDIRKELTKTIKSSYQRFTDHFDSRKHEIGLKEQHCPDLSQDEIYQIHRSIVSLLSS